MHTEYMKNHTKTDNLAVVVPLDNGIVELSFFQSCLMGVYESADIHDYQVMVCYSDYRDLRHLKALVESHKVDGVIVTRTNNPDLTVDYLSVQGIPFVAVGAYPDDQVYQVDHNHEAACKELVDMTLMKKRKHVAFLGNQEQSVVTQRRYSGYCESLRGAHLKLDPRFVHLNVDNRIQMDRIISDFIVLGVDSIVCTDEVISYWAYSALRNRGIQVPTDVELSSCYHSNALEDYVPSITTIKYDAKQLGVVAGDTLFDLLAGKQVPRKQYLTYEFNIKKAVE